MHLQELTTSWSCLMEEGKLISVLEKKAVQLIVETFKERNIGEDVVLMSSTSPA